MFRREFESELVARKKPATDVARLEVIVEPLDRKDLFRMKSWPRTISERYQIVHIANVL
jgi:hypothetical protein